jgi:hypothetical protein
MMDPAASQDWQAFFLAKLGKPLGSVRFLQKMFASSTKIVRFPHNFQKPFLFLELIQS